MVKEPRQGISDAERQVLQSLWEEGPGTVRQVQQRLSSRGPDWTRSTVITLLQRLERKGYVASDKSEFAFVFRALVSREDVMHERMQQLANELADGQTAPLVLAFARRQRLSPKQLQELRQLVDELAARQSRGKQK
jgi:BlaI family transcriptional regulator, penicillinase repressor